MLQKVGAREWIPSSALFLGAGKYDGCRFASSLPRRQRRLVAFGCVEVACCYYGGLQSLLKMKVPSKRRPHKMGIPASMMLPSFIFRMRTRKEMAEKLMQRTTRIHPLRADALLRCVGGKGRAEIRRRSASADQFERFGKDQKDLILGNQNSKVDAGIFFNKADSEVPQAILENGC